MNIIDINVKTIKEIFVEYGITSNPNAYSPNDPSSQQELKRMVTKDAIRFLKVMFGDDYSHIHNSCDVTMLTDYFFIAMKEKGVRNVARRGWK